MGLDHLAVVQLVDRVGADHDERVGVVLADQVRLPPQQVGGAADPAAAVGALERRQHHQARRSVRSRSHGRPLARWSDSDVGWYCTDTQTSAMPECWQLLSGKSIEPVDARRRGRRAWRAGRSAARAGHPLHRPGRGRGCGEGPCAAPTPDRRAATPRHASRRESAAARPASPCRARLPSPAADRRLLVGGRPAGAHARRVGRPFAAVPRLPGGVRLRLRRADDDLRHLLLRAARLAAGGRRAVRPRRPAAGAGRAPSCSRPSRWRCSWPPTAWAGCSPRASSRGWRPAP